MVYSEKVKARGGLKPLRLVRVLSIIYAFGGFSVLCAILSKFIVQPLFEQLSYDRSMYAREARDRLTALNFMLQRTVSEVPQLKSNKKYVDAQTQTDTTATRRIADPERNDWNQFRRIFHNPDAIYTAELEKKLVSDLDQTQQYLRALMYGQIRNYGTTDLAVARGDSSSANKDAVAALRLEIRSFKGSVLSL